jgi:hypothetical protein
MAADGDSGLDFDVALTACCIVADANWDDGYLAQTVAGNNVLQRVDRPQDGLLRGLEYFFCVKGRDPLCIPCPCIILLSSVTLACLTVSVPVAVKYPVIPSFHHWRFPHGSFDENGVLRGNLPPPWKHLRLPEFAPPRPTLKGLPRQWIAISLAGCLAIWMVLRRPISFLKEKGFGLYRTRWIGIILSRSVSSPLTGLGVL